MLFLDRGFCVIYNILVSWREYVISGQRFLCWLHQRPFQQDISGFAWWCPLLSLILSYQYQWPWPNIKVIWVWDRYSSKLYYFGRSSNIVWLLHMLFNWSSFVLLLPCPPQSTWQHLSLLHSQFVMWDFCLGTVASISLCWLLKQITIESLLFFIFLPKLAKVHFNGNKLHLSGLHPQL